MNGRARTAPRGCTTRVCGLRCGTAAATRLRYRSVRGAAPLQQAAPLPSGAPNVRPGTYQRLSPWQIGAGPRRWPRSAPGRPRAGFAKLCGCVCPQKMWAWNKCFGSGRMSVAAGAGAERRHRGVAWCGVHPSPAGVFCGGSQTPHPQRPRRRPQLHFKLDSFKDTDTLTRNDRAAIL